MTEDERQRIKWWRTEATDGQLGCLLIQYDRAVRERDALTQRVIALQQQVEALRALPAPGDKGGWVMSGFYRIKGARELEIIAALDYRRHQRVALSSTVATLYVAEVYAD
jgi:hypothetical protein